MERKSSEGSWIMAISDQWLEVAFGKGFQGLTGTIGYRLYDNTGADVVARTTVGVVAVGPSGSYGAVVPTLADSVVGIEWDTANVSGSVFANEDIGELVSLSTVADDVWNAPTTLTASNTFGEKVAKKLLDFNRWIGLK